MNMKVTADKDSLALSSRLASRLTPCLRGLNFAQLCFGVLFCCAIPLEAQKENVNERFGQATEAMREGRLDEAAAGFAGIVKDSPEFAEAYFNLGLVREEQGRNEEALTSLAKALALKPRLHGVNLFIGIAEYRLNHIDQAVRALRRETANFPLDASAWMWLGVAELAAERPADAAAALDKAVELDPNNVDILYHRGRAHLLVSKDSYAKMYKIDPNSWRVHQVLAQADAEADRHEEAIAEYLAAIRLAPHQPGLHEELGTEYRQTGKMEEAKAAFAREVEIDPHNSLVLYKLGTLAVEQGDGANGKASIEAALKQNPNLKDSLYYLGRAEAELGNNPAAVEALKRAVSEASDGEIAQQAWYQLGIVYRKMQRPDEAQKALAAFQKLKNEEAARQQGRAAKALGKDSAAVSGAGQNPE